VLSVGEDITPEVVFPVLFIKEEQEQSQLILKHLLKEKRLEDFMIEGMLEKQKIIDEISEKMKIISVDDKKRVNLQLGVNPLIEEIIINKFVNLQLNSKKEMKTKLLFEDLRSECLEVVEQDGSSSGFIVNQNKLLKKIERKIALSKNDNLEESLIVSSEINMPLLKDAIKAYAFGMHTLNFSPVDVDIAVKQKIPARSLFKFQARLDGNIL